VKIDKRWRWMTVTVGYSLYVHSSMFMISWST